MFSGVPSTDAASAAEQLSRSFVNLSTPLLEISQPLVPLLPTPSDPPQASEITLRSSLFLAFSKFQQPLFSSQSTNDTLKSLASRRSPLRCSFCLIVLTRSCRRSPHTPSLSLPRSLPAPVLSPLTFIPLPFLASPTPQPSNGKSTESTARRCEG